MLRAFGIDKDEEINEIFQDVDRNPDQKFIEETLKRDTTHNQAEALVEIYQRLRPGDLATPDTAKELIENMFFNFERYDLSKVGRWRMWQRFPGLKGEKGKSEKDKGGEEITVKDRVLKVEDIVAGSKRNYSG